MKILICIPCLLTGGTEIQTLNTVHALVQGGHQVTVACYFEHTPDMVDRYRKAGAEVLLFSPEGVRVGGYKSILFLYKHLRRAVRTVRPDVTHVQYMAPGATVILLLWLMGVKNIIATAHTAADIYRDLRLIHFLQRHCLRAWTCITERAESSFFGASQLYTPDMVLGRRNHFTIYNALPLRYSERLKVIGEGLEVIDHPDGNSKHYTLHTKQVGSHADFTDYTEGKLLRPCCLPDGNTTHYTLNSTQEISHTDCTDYTDSLSCQHDLDTITQKTHCFARVDHPDGVPVMSALNLTQKSQNSQNNENGQQSTTESSQSQSSSSLSSSSQKKPSDSFVLGVVSRLEAIKGMDLVVPALAEVLKVHPDTQLLVVGDGSLRASMEQQAVELGCADHIRWVGRQPQEELPQWYGQMDIVLMPSRSEGFGLTAIEAMACGCVMVASDTGGLPEVVRDGVCGLLHRTEDITDMAAKINALIGDQELYATLRTQSLREVEKYSFERYAELIQNLYSKL